MSDDTYQPKIYRTNNGDNQVAKEGAIFEFFEQEFTATQIAGLLRNTNGAVTITNLSTGSTVLSDHGGSSPPILPSTYPIIYLSCTSTMINGSARMFSGYAGQMLQIRFTDVTGSAASVLIYCSGHTSGISGVRVLASTGSDISSISMRQSAASFAWIEMRCVEDGVWAIVNASSQVTGQTA